MAADHDSLDERYGPPLHGEGGHRWRRRLAYVAAGAGLVALLGLAGILGTLWYGTQQVGRVDIPSLATPGTTGTPQTPGTPAAPGHDVPEPEELTEVLNILVVGSDSREGLTDDQLRRLGTEREEGERTDSIVLVQLDPRREQVAMLSFPRDLLVTRCDGSRGRINAAYGIGERNGVGGPSCLVDTIVDFTGIPVHHYVQVDFAGFIEVVDALGGVTLYLDEPLADAHAGIDLPSGCVDMDGATALGFVRARRIDSDFGRIARQQRFAREVVTEAVSVGTLVNLPRLYALIDAGARAVDTDRELTVGQMRRIAFSLRDLDPERLDTRTVPAVPRTIDGTSFVVAIEDEAERLFRAFRDAEAAPGDLGTQEPGPMAVEDVPPLVVLNGSGIAGSADRAARVLAERGFTVAETGNAEHFEFAETRVVYAEEQLEEAEVVADELGGVTLEPGDEGQPLTIVLGADFDPDAFATAQDEPQDETDPPSPAPEETYVGAEPSAERCR